ncbi:MAG: hypothetical protein HUU46_01665 [Candidatus Hydrogenedentes bacterium]|nr:hypothetical protein [Candidatus Hydrogenedentota bacterium]
MLKFARLAMVPFLVVMAVALIAGCGGGDAAKPADSAPAADAAKPADAPKPADEAKPADAAPAPSDAAPSDATMEEKKPEDAAPASTPADPAAAPAAGVALDATTIIGTKWSAAGYVLAFQEGGVVKINDDTEGTWKIDSNKLSIDAGGTVYEATIEGDKIMYEGAPLEKL